MWHVFINYIFFFFSDTSNKEVQRCGGHSEVHGADHLASRSKSLLVYSVPVMRSECSLYGSYFQSTRKFTSLSWSKLGLRGGYYFSRGG